MPKQTANQTSYYPEVKCETSKGNADWEIVVGVEDEKGRKQFLSVSKGMHGHHGKRPGIPIHRRR